MQKTIKNAINFDGIGLHSGNNIKMLVLPAPVDSGIVFFRTDLPKSEQIIPAKFDLVNDTRLNTSIANSAGANIATIEHLMAAFAGMGITNALVEVDGAEIPVYDGSSEHFVREFWRVGVVEQERSEKLFKVIKPVQVEAKDGAFASLSPCDYFVIDFEIDFEACPIGQQHLRLDMANGVFIRELANCRTFVRFSEVQYLQKAGLALGGSLRNAVVVNEHDVLNPEGFRRPDECVRHKMLDALGDLFLIGGSLIGEYRGVKAGHALTNQLLRKAVQERAIVEVANDQTGQFDKLLPGYGVEASDFAWA